MSSWRPAFRCDSTIKPKMCSSPAPSWRATSAATSTSRIGSLSLFAWVGSVRRRCAQTGVRERRGSAAHAGGVVVGFLSTAQDDMTVLVAAGLDDRHLAVLVDRQEMVPLPRREYGIHGDPHVAVGAVLEADRCRQTRGELAMHLGLGGARADRAPADEVADVLRGYRVQEFRPRGHAEPVDSRQRVAREAGA